MKFKTQMWHPNSKNSSSSLKKTHCLVYPDGTVCISILHAPGEDAMNSQEHATERFIFPLFFQRLICEDGALFSESNKY